MSDEYVKKAIDVILRRGVPVMYIDNDGYMKQITKDILDEGKNAIIKYLSGAPEFMQHIEDLLNNAFGIFDYITDGHIECGLHCTGVDNEALAFDKSVSTYATIHGAIPSSSSVTPIAEPLPTGKFPSPIIGNVTTGDMDFTIKFDEPKEMSFVSFMFQGGIASAPVGASISIFVHDVDSGKEYEYVKSFKNDVYVYPSIDRMQVDFNLGNLKNVDYIRVYLKNIEFYNYKISFGLNYVKYSSGSPKSIIIEDDDVRTAVASMYKYLGVQASGYAVYNGSLQANLCTNTLCCSSIFPSENIDKGNITDFNLLNYSEYIFPNFVKIYIPDMPHTDKLLINMSAFLGSNVAPILPYPAIVAIDAIIYYTDGTYDTQSFNLCLDKHTPFEDFVFDVNPSKKINHICIGTSTSGYSITLKIAYIAYKTEIKRHLEHIDEIFNVENGNTFIFNDLQEDIANGDSVSYYITNSTSLKYLIDKLAVSAEGDLLITIYKNPSITANGNQISAINANSYLSTTPQINIYSYPSWSDTGAPILQFYIAGTGTWSYPQDILKNIIIGNDTYLVLVQNVSGNNLKYLSLTLRVREVH